MPKYNCRAPLRTETFNSDSTRWRPAPSAPCPSRSCEKTVTKDCQCLEGRPSSSSQRGDEAMDYSSSPPERPPVLKCGKISKMLSIKGTALNNIKKLTRSKGADSTHWRMLLGTLYASQHQSYLRLTCIIPLTRGDHLRQRDNSDSLGSGVGLKYWLYWWSKRVAPQ